MKRVKNSIFLQLMLLISFLILLMAGAYSLTNLSLRHMNRDASIEMNENAVRQTVSQISDFYEHVDHVITAMVYSPTTSEYFFLNTADRVIATEKLSEIFSNTVLLENGIVGVYLFDRNLNRIAGMGKGISDSELDPQMIEGMEFGNLFYLEQTGVGYYSVYYPVYNLKSQRYAERIGLCVAVLSLDSLDGLLENMQITEGTQAYLVDSQGQVLTAKGNGNKDVAVLPEDMLTSTGTNYVTVTDLRMDGWQLVVRIPEQEMGRGKESGREFLVLAYVLAFSLLVILVCFISKRLVRPLKQINQFIQRTVEHPEERLEIARMDEIGMTADRLNRMLDRQREMNQEIQESQKQMYEAELAQKQLQLLAYRNQINPHFLYNTFECICSMAAYYEVEDIAEITMALSNVFRFAVKGENVVTVEEEAAYIQEYGKIIHYRFGGKIAVNVELGSEVRNKRVIKLILQPLVENAVFHGLEQKRGGGRVKVSIHKQWEDHIVFAVEDNGCGMPSERLEELRKSLEQPQDVNAGIGVANIYHRLQLYYGEDTIFLIDSKEDAGTRVTIVIPDNI